MNLQHEQQKHSIARQNAAEELTRQEPESPKLPKVTDSLKLPEIAILKQSKL